MNVTSSYRQLNYTGKNVELGILSVLKQFLKVEKGNEVTYQYQIQSLVAQWFIIVNPSNEARADFADNGKSIRFQLIDSKNKVVKQGRVLRRVGWELKLQQKVKDLIAEAHKRSCPSCKHNLVYRSGPTGLFMGCERYPDCKYTKQIRNEKRSVN